VNRRVIQLALASLALVAAVAPARADEPDRARTLALADGKMTRGLYEDAAKLYEAARPDQGSAAAYNHALALLNSGKAEDGEAALKEVVASAHAPRIAADGAFNLGRSLHERALAQKNEQAKLKLLEQAEGAFRAGVDAAPSPDRDAARALELTRREIKTIKDEIDRRKQQEQQQVQKEQEQKDRQRKEDQQKLADQLHNLADKQDQAEENTQKNQQRAQDQPDQKQHAKEQSKQDQQSVNKETQNASKELSQQRQAEQESKDLMNQAQKSMEQAQAEQKQAQDSLDDGDFDKAREHQRAAAEKLREAAKSIEESADRPPTPDKQNENGENGQEAQKKDQQGQEQALQQDKSKDGPGKRQETQAAPANEKSKGDKLANQLLDREEANRKARARLIRSMQGAPTPVERDW